MGDCADANAQEITTIAVAMLTILMMRPPWANLFSDRQLMHNQHLRQVDVNLTIVPIFTNALWPEIDCFG
ncbi:MAG: hypothetical protein WD176_05540, partial [Pirellulales bacterium]